MAKYIDLDNIPYACQNMTVKQLIEKTEIHENVIKRSKIDKAIEEIEQAIKECKLRWAVTGMEHALGILKRNVEE